MKRFDDTPGNGGMRASAMADNFLTVWAPLTMSLLGVGMLVACGDEESSSNGGDAGPTVYMLQTLVQTPDGRTVLLHLVNDLEDSLDPSKAVEFSGASRARVAFGKIYTFR